MRPAASAQRFFFTIAATAVHLHLALFVAVGMCQQYTQDFEAFPVSWTETHTVTDGFVTVSGGIVAKMPSGQILDPSNVYQTTRAYFNGSQWICVGCLSTITITFASPVSHVSFKVIEPTADSIHCAPTCPDLGYSVQDDLGHAIYIPYPLDEPSPGTVRLADLPYNGISYVQITNAAPPVWTIDIDDIAYYPMNIQFHYCDAQNVYDFSGPNTEAKVLTYEAYAQEYPPGQVAPDQFMVTATLNGDPGLVGGQQVFLRIVDPPETAPYGTPHAPDDNLDRGAIAGTFQPQGTKTLALSSDVSGTISFTVNTTDRFAGDNYMVQASYDPAIISDPAYECRSGCYSTGQLTAWKRIYVEADAMFRNGAFITAVAGPGSTLIRVSSTAPFGRKPGAAVRLVHAPRSLSSGTRSTPFYFTDVDANGLPLTVAQIGTGSITLSGPIPDGQTYEPTNQTSAPYLADGVGVINTSNDFFSANATLLPALDEDALVEIVAPSLAGGSCECVPYYSNFVDSAQNDMRAMGFLWLDRSTNSGTPLANTHHLIGGSQQNSGATLGFRVSGYSIAWVWLQTIESKRIPSGGTLSNAVAEVSAHEATHIWGVNYQFTGDGHCNNAAYVNRSQFPSEGCLMQPGSAWLNSTGTTMNAERCDGVIDLHYDPSAPAQLPSKRSEYLEIRQHPEPFGW